MKILFQILLSSLALVLLSQGLSARDGGDVSVFSNTVALAEMYPQMKRLERKVSYTLGQRETGDHLIYPAAKKAHQTGTKSKRARPDRKINYVEVNFLDNMESQRPFVAKGGIGQSSIMLVVDKDATKSIQVYATRSEQANATTAATATTKKN